MSSSLRATAPTPALGASLKGETTNNKRTYVLRGQLVAQPFSTSAKPFKGAPAGAEPFGKVNSILNPPNAERTTHASSTHNLVACTVQTAGTVHKRKVPYSMNAPRNRLHNPQKAESDPFTTQLDLQNGGISNSTVYPYRTISRTVQKPTEQAMETRIGWTNPGASARARLWGGHAPRPCASPCALPLTRRAPPPQTHARRHHGGPGEAGARQAVAVKLGAPAPRGASGKSGAPHFLVPR